MSTKWQRIDWIGSNVVFWTLTILAFIIHVHWAFSLWVFLTWVYTLVWITMFVGTFASTARRIPRSVPVPVSFTSDLLVACVVAAAGHWAYATLVLIQALFEIAAKDRSSTFPVDVSS